MLSRVADSLYWINRYVERAENISRFLEVSEAMALDCPPGSAEPWLPLVDANGDRKRFDEAYPQGTPRDPRFRATRVSPPGLTQSLLPLRT